MFGRSGPSRIAAVVVAAVKLVAVGTVVFGGNSDVQCTMKY